MYVKSKTVRFPTHLAVLKPVRRKQNLWALCWQCGREGCGDKQFINPYTDPVRSPTCQSIPLFYLQLTTPFFPHMDSGD